VYHVVYVANYAVFNITQPGHWFQDNAGGGYVYRNVQVDRVGVFVQTYGAGNGPLRGPNNLWVNTGGWARVDQNIRQWFLDTYRK